MKKQNKKTKDKKSQWVNLKQIYAIMFHYWGYIIGGIVTTILYALMNGISITMIVPVLDIVLKPKTITPTIHTIGALFRALWDKINFYLFHNFTYEGLKNINHSGLLNELKQVLMNTNTYVVLETISIIIVLLFVLKNLFYYLNKYTFTNLRGRSVRDIRNLMYSKYLSQSLAFFNQNRVGDSQVRLDTDVTIVSNEFISNLFIVLRDFTVMISCMIIAYMMNPHLFLISLLVTPVFVISVSYLGKKIKKYAKRIQLQYSTMFSQVEEALNSMRIVKAFSKEDFELKNYKTINNKHRKLWQKVEMYTALNLPISEISSALIGVVILMVAGHEMLTSQGQFTLGEFTAFLVAIFAMMHPLKTLTQAYANIKKALVSLDRISYVLNLQPEIKEAENAVEKKTFDDKINLNNVGFYYKKNKWVLRGVTFDINKGEKVALVGSSGSGKTTLANLLNRMYDLKEGEITIDGIPITQIKIKDLRSLFGIVPQESQLFSNTFAYNIQYGNQEALDESKIIEAAKIAYADEFIETYPDKYNHMLQVKGSDLSGGQKQRLCIARAIAANPPILIFDEATSALDSDSEKKVQEAIDRATSNRTVIIIAHRLSTILGADKIVVLDKGRVVGIGKHEELLKSCPRYQQLYNLQFNVKEKRVSVSPA
ncbi:MAG TPA: ABC transporter ATP-binding protein [Candidatus Cloacimonadota bacterium]|nr:ABC transporter ATP-binding protein [Candidatus Cloacimonadota bacterium]HQL14216.1 ABC transporter ATP-binding protein [Candidatus Cloacimonadota bacterium]